MVLRLRDHAIDDTDAYKLFLDRPPILTAKLSGLKDRMPASISAIKPPAVITFPEKGQPQTTLHLRYPPATITLDVRHCIILDAGTNYNAQRRRQRQPTRSTTLARSTAKHRLTYRGIHHQQRWIRTTSMWPHDLPFVPFLRAVRLPLLLRPTSTCTTTNGARSRRRSPCQSLN